MLSSADLSSPQACSRPENKPKKRAQVSPAITPDHAAMLPLARYGRADKIIASTHTGRLSAITPPPHTHTHTHTHTHSPPAVGTVRPPMSRRPTTDASTHVGWEPPTTITELEADQGLARTVTEAMQAAVAPIATGAKGRHEQAFPSYYVTRGPKRTRAQLGECTFPEYLYGYMQLMKTTVAEKYKTSARQAETSARQAETSARLVETSARLAETSARLPHKTSARLPHKTSARLLSKPRHGYFHCHLPAVLKVKRHTCVTVV